MAEIPDGLMLHTVVVRRHLGSTAKGESYAPDETVPCFVEDSLKFVRDQEGKRVASSARFWCKPTVAAIPPESEVDVNGRTTTVITIAKRSGGGLPTPDHWEVTLV